MELWILMLAVVLLLAGAGAVWFLRQRRQGTETPYLLLQQQLEALRGELRQTLEGSSHAMTEQLKNQLEHLQKTHVGIDQRLDNAGKVFVAMESRMVKIEEATKQVLEVGKDISTLQQILKSPKLRGNFGELLLGDLLSQMLPRDAFELQYHFQSGEAVDAVIKMAHGLVPVDAKFPLENFQRFIETQEEEERKSLRKKFLADVKKHVGDIASKYILPSEGTFEFALMYIPAENVYYEIITKDLSPSENESLVSFCMKKKVIPVSPNTFYAYLETILFGLRGMQVEKRVREIVTELARLRKELGNFRDDFSLVGKHLGNAVSSFEKSDRRLTRLEDKLSTMEVLPSSEEPLEVTEKSSAAESPLEQ